MTAPRKKWSTTTYAGDPRRSHPSKPAAYRYVQARADEFHAGMLRRDFKQVVVWVDEGYGRGWQRYETVNLDALPGGVS
ncbi:hypothetical protein ACFFX1_55655 [Dactylosporangium sucinum]|uniref:Uncharacterized protein n=1 Tax=Dactylosporangium sucinum TaxID=1424081 RepID=A0A917U4A8_9ACTN|nr:hypothetical protein [Dactylosporangium sucinum]GGM52284.1 hypothetical protein GCM10007977_062330 [Dactylosporangium sucinum]